MNDKEYLIETMTIDLAKMLIDRGIAADIKQAMDMIYNSDTYEKMSNQSSWLAWQHPGYVFNYLQDEFSLGKL